MNLRQQIGSSETKELLETTITVIKDSVAVAATSSLVMSFFLSGVLQFLWSLINGLQVIVLSILFSVMFPANAEAVFITIMSLVNMDMFGSEVILQSWFSFKSNESFNPIFEKAGYETTTYILNLGPIFFFVPGFLAFVILRELIKYYLQKKNSNLTLAKYMKQKIQSFSYKVFIVRFLLEGCIELGLSAMICVLSLGGVNSEKNERR